jgi:hypothetical protein
MPVPLSDMPAAQRRCRHTVFGWWSGLSGSPSPPSARGKANRTLAPFPDVCERPHRPALPGIVHTGRSAISARVVEGKAAARYRDEATTVRHLLVRLRDDTDPTSRNTASRPSGSRDEHDDAGTEGGRHVGRRAARP